MKQCQMCGQQNDDYASNCIKCGAPFQQQSMYQQQNMYQQPVQNEYNQNMNQQQNMYQQQNGYQQQNMYQQQNGYNNYQQPVKKSGGKKVLIIILVIVIFMLLCCGGGIFGLIKFGKDTIDKAKSELDSTITSSEYASIETKESETVESSAYNTNIDDYDEVNDIAFYGHNITIKILNNSIKVREEDDTFYIDYDIVVENESDYDITLQYDNVCVNKDPNIYSYDVMSFVVDAHSENTIKQEIEVYKKNYTSDYLELTNEQLTDYLYGISIDFALLDANNYMHNMIITDVRIDGLDTGVYSIISGFNVDYDHSDSDWIDMLDGTYVESNENNESNENTEYTESIGDTQTVGFEGYFETEIPSDWEYTNFGDATQLYASHDGKYILTIVKSDEISFDEACDEISSMANEGALELMSQKNSAEFNGEVFNTFNFAYESSDNTIYGGTIGENSGKLFLVSLETTPGSNIDYSEYNSMYYTLMNSSIAFGW